MTDEIQWSALPELTEDKLAELRVIYYNAAPTRKGANSASTHNGLRAVYEHLRALATLPADELLALAEMSGQPPAEPGRDVVTADSPDDRWDVLVKRSFRGEWQPVDQLIEAIATLNLAFPKTDFGRVEFVSRPAGHLLVDVLPKEDAATLASGKSIVRDAAIGYRVIVPAEPPEGTIGGIAVESN